MMLMGMGIILIVVAVGGWMFLRLPDQVAVAQLPTAAPFESSVATVAAPNEVGVAENPAANSDTTTLQLVTVAPDATPEPTVTPLPTAPLRELPSVASLGEAPTSLRETIVGQPSRIVIPAIGVDAPVRDVGLSSIYDQADGPDPFYQWQVPQSYAAGWHHTSAPLGEPGNTVLNGHQNVFGEIFRDLQDLNVGDGIIMYDDEESHLYEVVQVEIFPERGQELETRQENARWIKPTADERLTLVTCWPYTDNSHRLVVVARPVDS